jgi:hypothetical protein
MLHRQGQPVVLQPKGWLSAERYEDSDEWSVPHEVIILLERVPINCRHHCFKSEVED